MMPDGLERLRNARILVVEDSIANQTLARDLLLHAGARVVLAGNGVEAIAAVRNAGDPYDVILMDLQMPVMDGLEATRVLREELKSAVPIVATSAYTDEKEQERCIKAGANDCLPKPFHIHQLYEMLLRWMPQVERVETVPVVLRPAASWSARDIPLPATLSGVDMASGLTRVGQNRELYAKLLVEFSESNTGLPEEMLRLERHGDRGRIRFLAHGLRSTAGNIGAEKLSMAAAEVEIAAIDGTDDLGQLVQGFAGQLREVIEGIAAAGIRAGRLRRDFAEPARPFDRDEAQAKIARLLEMLDDHDMAAQQEFESLADMLGGPDVAGILGDLAESMDALDYANARQILVQAEQDLLR